MTMVQAKGNSPYFLSGFWVWTRQEAADELLPVSVVTSCSTLQCAAACWNDWCWATGKWSTLQLFCLGPNKETSTHWTYLHRRAVYVKVEASAGRCVHMVSTSGFHIRLQVGQVGSWRRCSSSCLLLMAGMDHLPSPLLTLESPDGSEMMEHWTHSQWCFSTFYSVVH